MSTTAPNMPGIKFDWISFTIPENHNDTTLPALVQQLFGVSFGLFQLQERKRNYYKRSWLLSGPNGDKLVEIFTDPDTEGNRNTTLFQITGFTLSAYAANPLNIDPRSLFNEIAALKGRPTVLHICMDDTDGRLPWSEIEELSQPDRYHDHIISPLLRPRRDGAPQPPLNINGQTIYYGKRQGRNSVCIYRKDRLEQTKFPWTRVEYRTTDRAIAAGIMQKVIDGDSLGTMAAGLVRRFLDFRKKTYHSKYNRPQCAWWGSFLGGVEKMVISRDLAPRRMKGPTAKRQRSVDSILKELNSVLGGWNTNEDDFEKVFSFIKERGLDEMARFASAPELEEKPTIQQPPPKMTGWGTSAWGEDWTFD